MLYDCAHFVLILVPILLFRTKIPVIFYRLHLKSHFKIYLIWSFKDVHFNVKMLHLLDLNCAKNTQLAGLMLMDLFTRSQSHSHLLEQSQLASNRPLAPPPSDDRLITAVSYNDERRIPLSSVHSLLLPPLLALPPSSLISQARQAT